jgi:hypothetical protein
MASLHSPIPHRLTLPTIRPLPIGRQMGMTQTSKKRNLAQSGSRPNLEVVRDVAELVVQSCACDTRIPPNREHALAGVSVRFLAKMAREGTIPGKKVGGGHPVAAKMARNRAS